MKKINLILVVIFLTLNCSINAQVPVLMGMTNTGGANNYGTIFKIYGDSTGFQVVHDFESATGRSPQGSMFRANNNILYGMTRLGGLDSSGVIFSFNPNTLIYTEIIDLNGLNGKTPSTNNDFMQGSNGKLYCTINGGGDSSRGVIGCLDPSNNNYSVLHSFSASTFFSPASPAIQLNNGLMYGLCPVGGSLHQGGIYSFDINGNIYSQIHNSINTTGNAMRGYIVQYNDTIIYGCASGGGLHGDGTIFSYNLINNTYTDLFDFTAAINGGNSMSGLIKASNGILYGTSGSSSSNGPNYWGTLFSFDPSINSFAVLHYFNDTAGRFPVGGLLQASDGKLYGMTQSGGANYGGVVYSYDIITNTYTVIHNFNGTDGNSPFGNLTEITETSTGVSVLSKENGVSVYPNPAATILNIHQTTTSPNELVIITDIVGREVYKVPLTDIDNTIELSQWSNGIYFYEVKSEKESIRGKFIKE